MRNLLLFSRRSRTKLSVDTDLSSSSDISNTTSLIEVYVESRDMTTNVCQERERHRNGLRATSRHNNHQTCDDDESHSTKNSVSTTSHRRCRRRQIHFWKEEEEEESMHGVDDYNENVHDNDENSHAVYRFVDEHILSSNSKKKKIQFVPVPPRNKNATNVLFHRKSNFVHCSTETTSAIETLQRDCDPVSSNLHLDTTTTATTMTTRAEKQGERGRTVNNNGEIALLDERKGANECDDSYYNHSTSFLSSSFWTMTATAHSFTSNASLPHTSLYWVRLTPTLLTGIMATPIIQAEATASAPEPQSTVVAYIRLWEAPGTTSSTFTSTMKCPTLYSIPLPTTNIIHGKSIAPGSMKDLYAVWAQPQNAFCFPLELLDPTDDSLVDSDTIVPVFVQLEVGIVVHGEERPFGVIVLDAMAIIDGRRSHNVQVSACLHPVCKELQEKIVSIGKIERKTMRNMKQQPRQQEKTSQQQQQEPLWFYELGNDSTFYMQLATQQCPPYWSSSQERYDNWKEMMATENMLERLWKSKSFDSKYSVVFSPGRHQTSTAWCGCNVSTQVQPYDTEPDQVNAQSVLEAKETTTFSDFYTIMSKCTDLTIPNSDSAAATTGICQSSSDAARKKTFQQDKLIRDLPVEMLFRESSARRQPKTLRSTLASKLNKLGRSLGQKRKSSSAIITKASKNVSLIYGSTDELDVSHKHREGITTM